MSERSSANGSAQRSAESVATIAPSPIDAEPDDAIGVADGSTHDRDAATGETTSDSPTISEHDAEPALSGAVDDGTAFLAELVDAFRATAARERTRLGEETDRRRQTLVDQIRAREATEVERIRELAASDMKGIEAWVAGEKERIRRERERRTTELNEDLDLSLSEHHSKIEVEIQGVESVIATYREAVEAFFEGLEGETDLVIIAQEAAKPPAFPTIDSLAKSIATDTANHVEAEPVSAEASSAGIDDEAGGAGSVAGGAESVAAGGEIPAVDVEARDEAERALVGVMDPDAAGEPVESLAAPPEASPEPASAGPSEPPDDGGMAGDRAEPVTAPVGANDRSSSSLLQSMPVKQPMGWLRRHVISGEGTNGES